MKPKSSTKQKFIAGLVGVLAIWQSAHAQFTFPVYEPFAYTQGEQLGVAGSSATNWTAGNSLSISQIITTNAALSYIGLLPDGNATPMGLSGPTGVGRTRIAPFTAQTAGTVYASALINLKSYPSGNRAIFGMSSANSGTPSPSSGSPSVWVNSAGQLLLGKNNATTPNTLTTAPLSLNTTHLIVIAYTFVAGTTNDIVSLWVDPFLLGNNANIPAPTISFATYSGAGADSTTISSLAVFAPSSTPTMQVFYDEMRVNNNWAGVTTPSPAAGPAFAVTGGGAGCPGDSFNVGVSGSVTTNVYLLYTNSVFTGLAVNGTGSSVSFGPQSVTATYTVVASNTVNANMSWMTNSVSVSVLAGPVVITQPVPLQLATNSSGTFSATVTGSGLNYRWYRNGVGLTDSGHFSGTTTATLLVSPATTADIASTAQGYYCIITNSCGLSAITVTNSLTLTAASSIVWQGGNPNTNWDVASTPNFTNSAGTAVTFHNGDNVLLDDSATNQNITIGSGYIAPGVITENSSLNYAFTAGGGPLSGNASLLMIGSGTLTVSNANAFTGPTTISNGTVQIRTYNNPLGTGTINMSGGTLRVPLSGATGVGLTNAINVAADSTLQYDSSGTFGCVLNGVVDGVSGRTLTINNANANTSLNRIRLYSPFTNNANLILTSSGAEVELAPYHSTGDQVYGGIISGTVGRIVPRAGGNTVLSGQNTFDDSSAQNLGYSLFMSSGNVGFGADSTPTSGTIVSGPASKGIIGINVGSEGGNCSFYAYGGARTIGNPITYTSATNTVTVSITGSNNLTFSGPINLSGADGTGNTNRPFSVSNTGLTTFSGVVGDAALTNGISKSGGGTLILSGVNTYTGPTTVTGGKLWINGQTDVGSITVTNGQLGGTGIILGAVDINTGGTLAPGTTAIGTLTVNNSLSLTANALFKLNKSLAQSNDICTVSGTLAASGAGPLTVTNLGAALVVGDSFKIFNKAVTGGNTLAITGGGVTWTNKLAVDGSIQVLAVSGSLASYSTNITAIVNGSTLTVSWPTTHLGWELMVQTNTLATGLGNNWVTNYGTAAVTSTNLPINPANGAVFYKLVHP